MIVYKNVGLISKGSEDVASEMTENRRFQLPHCRLMPSVHGTPVEYRYKPYIARN